MRARKLYSVEYYGREVDTNLSLKNAQKAVDRAKSLVGARELGEVRITLAGDLPCRMWETTAPSEYDGFGTYEIAAGVAEDGRRVRLIEILERHLQWQTLRNASGLHATRNVEEPHPQDEPIFDWTDIVTKHYEDQ